MRCRLPGPQEPAQTASSPVICASPEAAKAATSSWRTWTQSIVAARAQRLGHAVQAVADDAVDPPDAGFRQSLHQLRVQ